MTEQVNKGLRAKLPDIVKFLVLFNQNPCFQPYLAEKSIGSIGKV